MAVIINVKLKSAKELFFDRKLVDRYVDNSTKRFLSKFGSNVFTTSRRSIRFRKRISRPGRPPSSHTGLLKHNIFFIFDRFHQSVVIGPILINRGGKAPNLLEFGGISRDERPERRQRRKRRSRVRPFLVYRPRPYMRPAFAQELAKLPLLLRASFRKASATPAFAA